MISRSPAAGAPRSCCSVPGQSEEVLQSFSAQFYALTDKEKLRVSRAATDACRARKMPLPLLPAFARARRRFIIVFLCYSPRAVLRAKKPISITARVLAVLLDARSCRVNTQRAFCLACVDDIIAVPDDGRHHSPALQSCEVAAGGDYHLPDSVVCWACR